MLGDILLIADKHREAGEAIIEMILKNRKPKMMIAISGESGSGKTELAHVIAKGMRKHGIFAKPLHIDNYYRIHPHIRTEWRKEHGIDKVVGPVNMIGKPLTAMCASLRKAPLPPAPVWTW